MRPPHTSPDATIVNALSSRFQIDSWDRVGGHWQLKTQRGVDVSEGRLTVAPACPIESGDGLLLRYTPDSEIFESSTRLTPNEVRETVEPYAAHHRGLRIRIHDDAWKTTEFFHKDGWLDWIRARMPKAQDSRAFVSEFRWSHCFYQVAIQHNPSSDEPTRILGFANYLSMNCGSHIDGLERALRSMPKWKRRLPRGLMAVISIDSPFFVHYSNRMGDPCSRPRFPCGWASDCGESG